MRDHYDVVVVGAGISGISSGYHLKTRCPNRSFVILEAREAIGGTWDLFRYPGIRSDSDMFTLGYAFKPWTHPKAIADGPSILEYLAETVEENDLGRHIEFGRRVTSASWSSADARWTVGVTDTQRKRKFITCSFLHMCTGYYRYEAGYTPDFPGVERFTGAIVHPQQWTDDVAYAGKRVVVIGSGATAVTLIPELAKEATQVTMLQRSPTYMVSSPSQDLGATRLRRFLPERAAHTLIRWVAILVGLFFYNLAQRRPERVKRILIDRVRDQVGPDYDVETHFTPSYKPWDQRVCLVPDGDFFEAVRSGRAEIVTDQIESFTEKGILLRSGRELEADLIVTATGLELQLMSNLAFTVDGEVKHPSDSLTYKGMMFSDIPNLALSIGYTNASWTLKCDLTSAYVCRLLNEMERKGYVRCMPRFSGETPEIVPWAALSSGYIRRSLHKMPKQTDRDPWRIHHNYLRDLLNLRFGRVDDGQMEFKTPDELSSTRSEEPAPATAPWVGGGREQQAS